MKRTYIYRGTRYIYFYVLLVERCYNKKRKKRKMGKKQQEPRDLLIYRFIFVVAEVCKHLHVNNIR